MDQASRKHSWDSWLRYLHQFPKLHNDPHLTKLSKAKKQQLAGEAELAEELQLVGMDKHTLTSPAELKMANKNRALKLRLKNRR